MSGRKIILKNYVSSYKKELKALEKGVSSLSLDLNNSEKINQDNNESDIDLSYNESILFDDIIYCYVSGNQPNNNLFDELHFDQFNNNNISNMKYNNKYE